MNKPETQSGSSLDPLGSEDVCPECGQTLKPVWHGLNACFCRWGGVQPDPEQIIAQAEGTRWN